MRPPLLLPLLLATAAPALAQAPARVSVPVVRYRVADADTAWMRETRCTEPFSDGTRACRRLVVSGAEGEDAPQDSSRFWVEGRNGHVLAQWAEAGTFYQSFGFDLVRLDLDGDGQVEHVVAHHESEGNGMGVRTWTLYVVDGRRPDARPLAFTSSDHGDDAFVRTRRGWRLLATAWEDGQDPRRGHGLYFTGRLYRYDGDRGTLVPDAAEPVRRRRYLNAFASERGRTYDAETVRGLPGQTPWRWLQHASTARLRADPALPTTRRLGPPETVRFLGPIEHEGMRGYAYRAADADAPSFTDPRLVSGTRALPAAYTPRGGWQASGVPARLTLYAPPPVPRGWEDTGGEATYVIVLD